MTDGAERPRAVTWRAPASVRAAALELAIGELRRGLAPSGLDPHDGGVEEAEADLVLSADLAVGRAGATPCGSTLESPSLLAGLGRHHPGESETRGVAVEIVGEPLGFPLHEVLRSLGREPLALLATDRVAAAEATTLLRALERGRRIDAEDGASLAAAIDRRRLVVACSLEVALVALARAVPFLLARRDRAVPAMLVERGLGSWTFASADELEAKAQALLSLRLDLRPLAERDRVALEARLAALGVELGGVGAAATPTALPAASAMPPPQLRGAEPSASEADPEPRATALRAIVARLAGDLHRLHHEVARQHARIGELAAEVDRQSGEIVRRETLLREILESRAWRLVSGAREGVASLRRRLGGGR